MKRIKCALIGLGRIGSLLEKDSLREKPCTHAGAIAENRDCVLSGGCDTSRKKRDLFREQWDCLSVYSKLEVLLRKEEPDIVHIATPVETHLDMVRRVIPFNPGLIILEKPVASNSKDALEILKLHRSEKARILINHERRYSIDYIRVKNHIDSRRFGHLLSVSAKLYMGQNNGAEEILLHDGTHLIDVIQFLTSCDLKLMYSRKYKKDVENLFILCRAGNLPVSIEVGQKRDYIMFEMDLIFSKGRIRIGNGLYEEFESEKSPYYEGMNSLKRLGAKRPRLTGYFSNMMKDAVLCFSDKTREPISNARTGYSVLSLIDRVRKSLK